MNNVVVGETIVESLTIRNLELLQRVQQLEKLN